MENEFFEIEGSRGWQALFQKLHQISRAQAGTQNEAKKPPNMPRNRYRDVLPIDETRVKLFNEDNDYINANLVKVDDVQRSYLLTQGPLQHTCAHFWQMVWEQKSSGILMLNKCVERGMNKCYQYFPSGGDQGRDSLQFGNFLIELEMCEEGSSYRLSHLSLTNTEEDESRTVLHFQYTQWPDFGVPKTADIFLNFLYDVRKSGVLEPDVGPCVVHCSAGIGRSGTFCLVDVCLKKIEDTGDGNSVKIRDILLDMRKQRLGLIQTPDQLRFSYIAILQGARYFLGYESESESDTGSEEEDEDDIPLQVNPAAKLNIHVYNDQISDLPPPIPPRPPDLLNHRDVNNKPESDEEVESSGSGSPPPPPTSLPPPSSARDLPHASPGASPSLPTKRPRVEEDDEDEIEEVLVSYKKRDSQPISESDEDISDAEEEKERQTQTADDKDTRKGVAAAEEEERRQTQAANDKDTRKESIEENEGYLSPPVPPRVQSVRRSNSPFVDAPPHSQSTSNKADHFLGEGKGGEVINAPTSPPALPPAANPEVQGADTNSEVKGADINSELTAADAKPFESLSDRNFEEQALINELQELEKLVLSVPEQQVVEEPSVEELTPLVETSSEERVPKVPDTTEDSVLRQRDVQNAKISEAVEKRKQEREKRHKRLQEKVEAIHMKQRQLEEKSKWMVPFVVGLAVVVGVGILYYLNK